MKTRSESIILITGASSGIGRAFANRFHQQGHKIVLVARRQELLNQISNELNSKRRQSAEALVADLSLKPDLEKVRQYIKNNKIDVLVNNAGFGSFNYFEKLSVEREVEMIRVNIEAPTVLSHAVIPQMKERRSGAIINVSSVAGFQPLPFMATYAATKAYDLWHSLGLWYELLPFNVHVLAVCPGPTATEFGGVARVPGTATGIYRDSVESVVEQSIRALEKRIPIVATGLRSKLMSFAARHLPLSITTRIIGRQLKPALR